MCENSLIHKKRDVNCFLTSIKALVILMEFGLLSFITQSPARN